MNFAVINPTTNKVENIICAETCVVGELSQGMGMAIVSCEGLAVDFGDDYTPDDGKFYRGGVEVSKIPSVVEQIQAAIDSYTLALISGGIV